MAWIRVFSVLLAACCCVGGAVAQRVRSELVVDGLEHPVFLSNPPGELDRFFVLEENFGRIRIVKNGTLLAVPFLDIGGKINFSGEQGLLGMAFHPDYANNGQFYVNYTDSAAMTIVARYEVSPGNPDLADPNSEQVLLSQQQFFDNHNGGMLAFGPNDGYLYIGLGDGGGGTDPFGFGQDTGAWLGKILRIDVDGGAPYAIPPSNPFVGPGDPLDEIWAIGVRNCWRFSFDRQTGDLWFGDPGTFRKEELNFEPAGSGGGRNYGWNIVEGTQCHNPPAGCNQAGLTPPLLEYDWDDTRNRICIIGGYVYRGSAIPGLQGSYFFADWGSHEVFSFRYDGNTITDFRDRSAELDPGGGLDVRRIASFSEDDAGELVPSWTATTARSGRSCPT